MLTSFYSWARLLVAAAVVSLALAGALPASAHETDDVVFNGSGWGHGVGMSQYGAYGMALNGYSDDEILAHYYRGTSVVDVSTTGAAAFIYEEAEPLWIGLMQDRTSFDFSLEGGGATLCQGWSSNSDCSLTARAGEVWRYETTDNGLCIFRRLEPSSLTGEPRDCDGSIRPSVTTTTTSLNEGYEYSSGTFRLRAVDSDPQSFHVVLQIGVDDYLRGIAEMPTWWHVEALKAQVIAARSYLIANTSSKGSQSNFSSSTKERCWCHLYDDSRSQVYKGDILLGSTSWQTAISETARQVVSYGGTLVTAYYSSSTGGWTENSEDVWTSAKPWLVSVDDSWAHIPEVNNPRSSWTRIRTRDAVADAVGLDVLHSVKVHKRASGGVAYVDFKGEVGGSAATRTWKGTSVRSLFGLPSHYFSIVTPDTSQPSDPSAYDIPKDSQAPIGWFEEASDEVEAIRVKGWIMDPDTPEPINAHIYVDGKFRKGLLADRTRADVQNAYANGKSHGFDTTFGVEAGSHKVCVYAINAPTRTNNPKIGCKALTVSGKAPEPPPDPKPDPNIDVHVPFGWIDTVAISSGRLTVAGWAIDEDSPDTSVGIHVYIDGKFGFGGKADQKRPDVGKAFGLGDFHGYSFTKPIDPGSHTVCIYAINEPSRTGNPRLGCKKVG